MKSAQYLSSRLNEALLDGKWVTGTNWKDELESVSFNSACQSIQGLNSISDLTFHITYYLKGVAQVLEGGQLTISDKYSFETPALTNVEYWDIKKSEFKTSALKFVSLVSELSDEQLESDFDKPEYGSLQRNIDVMIEHAYYHLGQILLIKKLILQD